MPSFGDINFRYTDARTENTHAPEIIEHAFVDVEGVSQQILRADRFIVSGQKGAGKTALAYRMLFLAQQRPEHRVWIEDLNTFEFNLLHYAQPQNERHTENTSTAWKCLLLMRMISIMADDVAYSDIHPEIIKVRSRLAAAGYMIDEPLSEVADRVRRPDFYQAIASLFQQSPRLEESDIPTRPAQLFKLLTRTFRALPEAPGWYLLFIDGLDDPMRFYENVRARRYMADLVAAVKDVNELLLTGQPRAKIILLAREEILKDLPDPNLTKTLVDFGLPLRWHDGYGRLETSSLVGVIARRAQLAGFDFSGSSLAKEWFPYKVNNSFALPWIARRTRYLPRDLIRFFAELQALGKEPPFTEGLIYRAAKTYSDWFYEELLDAIKGLVADEVRMSLKGMFLTLRQEFYLDEFANELDKRNLGDPRSAAAIARELFGTGWLGQYSDGTFPRRFESVYLNRRATFDRTRKCVIHQGLLPHLGFSTH
jgi:hypothetical protein